MTAVRQSRLTLARAAIRPSMKGRVMLSGPSGGGKTYTSLVIAETLAGPEGRILLIDTEKESSLTYADVFAFEHLRWNAPFDPTELAATLMDAGNTYDVIVIDSFSHFWRKQGGVLDIAGGKFTGWKEARPLQEGVLEAILETDAHVIACCRSKMEHVQEVENGKHVVRKLGVKAQQDDDFEYEVNVSLEIDMQHVLAVSKSRTNAVPVGRTFTPGQAGDFATVYRDWLAGGEAVAPRTETNALAAALNRIADEGERRKAKNMFVDAFGRPEFLLESVLPDAQAWVADRVAGVAPPAERAEDSTPPDEVPEPAASITEPPAKAEPPQAAPAKAEVPATDAPAPVDPGESGSDAGSVGGGPGEGVPVGSAQASSPSPETPAADVPPGPPPLRDGDDAAGAETAPAPTPPPAPPARGRRAGPSPTPQAERPSDPKQRMKLGMRCNELATAGKLAQGDKPEIVAAVTNGRATSTTEMTFDEANKMIALLVYLTNGDLMMVDDPAGGRAVASVTDRGADFLRPIVGGPTEIEPAPAPPADDAEPESVIY